MLPDLPRIEVNLPIEHTSPLAYNLAEQLLQKADLSEIQHILEKNSHKNYVSSRKINGKIYYYMTWQQFAECGKQNPELQSEIKQAFFNAIIPVAIQLSKTSPFNPEIYIMMMTIESCYGISFLAQTACNPYTINTDGKNLSYPTILWKDKENTRPHYIFPNLQSASRAFEYVLKNGKIKKQLNKQSKDNTGHYYNQHVLQALVLGKYAGPKTTVKIYTTYLQIAQDQLLHYKHSTTNIPKQAHTDTNNKSRKLTTASGTRRNIHPARELNSVKKTTPNIDPNMWGDQLKENQ